MQLLLLELNEVNFEFVEAYTRLGELPNLSKLISRHGLARTTSEDRYEQLEPWIQWVTAHTGQSFAEHGVYRLGDIVKHDHPQIWEALETRGFRVGAISPMNAKCRLRDAAFFVPDPWTKTEIIAPPLLQRLHDAICQIVNDNARLRVSISSALALTGAMLRYARPANYGSYCRLIGGAGSNPWSRAIVLDLLLADVFVREVARTAPSFASLFLNAAAHIQHHYMFSARPYRGPNRNPDWYVAPGKDPVLDVYRVYDRIVGHVTTRFPSARLMIATGLHQDPFRETKFYWRLNEHAEFLRRIGIPFSRVETRMSRDFVIECEDDIQAATAERMLVSATDIDGERLFEVDNRGVDLFVMLVYPKDILPQTRFVIAGRTFDTLRESVSFVALKNGEHNSIGYFVDSGDPQDGSSVQFPLKDLPARILSAFGEVPGSHTRELHRAS